MGRAGRWLGAYLSSLLIAIALVALVLLSRPRVSAETPTSLAPPVPTAGPVTVSVLGEVLTPGLYTLPASSRVIDAITAAGGPTVRADLTRINLAAILADGTQLVVRALPPPSATGRRTAPTPATPLPINLNTATEAQLDALPGIGPAKARAIVEYRKVHGPFRRAEDVQKVKGIGPSIWNQIKDKVTV